MTNCWIGRQGAGDHGEERVRIRNHLEDRLGFRAHHNWIDALVADHCNDVLRDKGVDRRREHRDDHLYRKLGHHEGGTAQSAQKRCSVDCGLTSKLVQMEGRSDDHLDNARTLTVQDRLAVHVLPHHVVIHSQQVDRLASETSDWDPYHCQVGLFPEAEENGHASLMFQEVVRVEPGLEHGALPTP